MGLKDLPNLISLLRILLVGPVVWAITEQRFSAAFSLFSVAAVSDALDGLLAKRFHWTSSLGGILDPVADKLLLTTSFVSLAWVGVLPWWLVVMVLSRDLLIVVGAVSYYLLIEPFDAAPTWTGKANTALQLILVIWAITSRGLLGLPVVLETGLIYAVAASTVLSGVGYVFVWGARARRQVRAGLSSTWWHRDAL